MNSLSRILKDHLLPKSKDKNQILKSLLELSMIMRHEMFNYFFIVNFMF